MLEISEDADNELTSILEHGTQEARATCGETIAHKVDEEAVILSSWATPAIDSDDDINDWEVVKSELELPIPDPVEYIDIAHVSGVWRRVVDKILEWHDLMEFKLNAAYASHSYTLFQCQIKYM